MLKEIILKNEKILYNLEIKKVKNINLRIKKDGTINVSANKRVPEKFIEEFLISKADFIFNALHSFENTTKTPLVSYFNEYEIKDVITSLCKKAYPYFEKRGVIYPKIRFRKMTTRWGSCNSCKGTLNFNINLMYAPIECIEYVVYHEFTHFLQANHSDKFYNELSKVCPEWKRLRRLLKEINI